MSITNIFQIRKTGVNFEFDSVKRSCLLHPRIRPVKLQTPQKYVDMHLRASL